MIINYIVALILATIVYLIAVRYIQQLCPMSKFFKLIIYICITTVSLPIVNYIYPQKAGEEDIASTIINTVSSTESNLSSSWKNAQQKSNSLINKGNSQNIQSSQGSDEIKVNTFSNDYQTNTDQSGNGSQYIIIGGNGKELD